MKRWLRVATVRAVKTLAQTAVATIGAAILSEVDWLTAVSAAASTAYSTIDRGRFEVVRII